jgi:hypothetical protein
VTDNFDLSLKFGDAQFSASGPSELVLDALGEFKAMMEKSPPSTRPVEDRNAEVSNDFGPKPPFPIFMKREWPNQAAKAAAIFTWAKRYDDKDRLRPSEMSTYWKKFDKKPGNPTMACQNAEQKGWLENVGNGNYAVTGHGENMVDGTPTLS